MNLRHHRFGRLENLKMNGLKSLQVSRSLMSAMGNLREVCERPSLIDVGLWRRRFANAAVAG